MDDLTDLERQILSFESKRWNHRGAKDEQILKEFGLTPWRYQQYVRALCERPASLAAFPSLVKRLRRHYRL